MQILQLNFFATLFPLKYLSLLIAPPVIAPPKMPPKTTPKLPQDNILSKANAYTKQSAGRKSLPALCILSINQILNCVLQALHLTQHPESQLGQSKGADEKRDEQKDQTILRRVCHQNSHAQKGNHHADHPQYQTRHIDQRHASPYEQGKQYHYRRDQNLQQ